MFPFAMGGLIFGIGPLIAVCGAVIAVVGLPNERVVTTKRVLEAILVLVIAAAGVACCLTTSCRSGSRSSASR
jgi:hypothetical protein